MKWYAWRLWVFAWAPAGGDFVEDDRGRWRPLCGRLWVRNDTRLHARLRWEPRDLWVGAFWDRAWQYPEGDLAASHASYILRLTGDPVMANMTPRLDVYVCLLPCLPVQVTWWAAAKRRPANRYVRAESKG